MIFRREVLDMIKKGDVEIAFRRWVKLFVKPGGTLKTSIGVLQFTSVTPIQEKNLKEREALAAGFGSLEDLLYELNLRKEGKIYLIRFKLIGEDPRVQLRSRSRLTKEERNNVLAKLAKMDRLSRRGPWTRSFLELLEKYPGVASKNLAPKVQFKDVLKFKMQVRKLKELGLTVSLGTGYKLSPRGKTLLKALRKS